MARPARPFRHTVWLMGLAALQCIWLVIWARRQARLAALGASRHDERWRHVEKTLRQLLERQSAVNRPDVATITAEVAAQLAHHHDRLTDALLGHAQRAPYLCPPTPRGAL